MAIDEHQYTGLTAAEVQERIARGESNAYQPQLGRTYWEIIRDNLLNVFNLILFPLLGVIIWFGEYAVAFFAGFSVVTNAFLGTIQEIVAKRRLDRLAAQAEQKVGVWRNGQLVEISSRELVKDDIMPLHPGDRLAVDGVVLASDALEMDESHLTGESDAILKDADDEVYSGSYCIAGTGVVRATGVGRNNTINRISASASRYKNLLTPTQKRIMSIVNISIIIMLLFAPMLWISDVLAGLVLLERVKNVVVFITSIVPYGLVLVVILSLTIGAISITRHKTLIRRVNAVESLANATVLCFDKTGTITQNKLAVQEIITLNGDDENTLKRRLHTYTSNLASLNSTAAAVSRYVETSANGALPRKVREIPFSSARKWGAVVLTDETLVLGAPERILRGHYPEITAQAHTLATQGLRVLAFARATEPPVENQLNGSAEPLALIILSDQVRPDIQATLQSFRDQNVALKVISGDNAETVEAIVKQAGITIEHAYTGDQLESMSDEEFHTAAAQGNVFARIEPYTKSRIVTALRDTGHHVAMVGDGVNDVPALKAADLAIVMNDGAAITKEIGDIILLNNAMSTLPKAFAEGTEITQTIYGTIKLFLVKAFYNILLFIFVGFMSLPFPITPIQINWVTFGTVNLAAGLIALKLLRPAYMEKFRRDVLDYVITGAVLGAALIALLYVVVYFAFGMDTRLARSALSIFITLYGILIFWNVSGIDIFKPRTFLENRVIFALGFALMLMTLLGFYIAPDLLEYTPLPPLVMIFVVALFELTMLLYSWLMRNRSLINSLWTLFAP